MPREVPAAERVVAATLDNGLRVLLLEDHRSPIVSFQVWYRVGSRDEQRGATGIAHFLEHMMRSEEHTSELQSPCNLVCRLLLEKKKKSSRRTGDSEARSVDIAQH